MNQCSLLFGEVRTCQNPCAAAGVILWTAEPNQPEESLAVSLPGPLACLSGSHFCLEHNILLCQLLQKAAVVLSFWWDGPRKHSLSTVCSSALEGACSAHTPSFWAFTKDQTCGCRNPLKQTVSVIISSSFWINLEGKESHLCLRSHDSLGQLWLHSFWENVNLKFSWPSI